MKKTTLFFYFLFSISLSLAQIPGDEQEKQSTRHFIVAGFNTIRKQLPVEKIYLHTDKPYYSINDTIWFKAYLFDRAYLTPAKSGLLYLELANDSNVVVRKMVSSVTNGLSWGSMALPDNEIQEGGYTLRAYTNWMRNFREEHVFSKSFYISRIQNQSWLVKLKPELLNGKVNLDLSIAALDGKIIGLRELDMQILQGKRRLYKNKLETDVDGKLNINFDLADKISTENLSLIIHDLRKGEGGRKISVPITVNRPENIDLQFMPEGGQLISGVPSRVAFKAIGEDGKGVLVEGKIMNTKNQQVGAFHSMHSGIGSFNLTPSLNETYTAFVEMPDKKTKSYSMPAVKSSGTALTIKTDLDPDSLSLEASLISDSRNNSSAYYLTGQARGVICYMAKISLKEGPLKIKLSKSLFPSGITRFTLLTDSRQALNERMVFIEHHDNLKISVKNDGESFSLRDSIPLNIQVTDHQGIPAQGSFSLSVTDDSQVMTDSDVNPSILSHMLLTSDLKGNIEDPDLYFDERFARRKEALDNLMLAQGWIGYDWKDVFNPPVAKHELEREFQVKGSVLNVFDRPIEGSNVTLLSKSPPGFKTTQSDKQGRFIFNNIPFTDTADFTLQALNKNDKNFNIGIIIQENEPYLFTQTNSNVKPWYLDTDQITYQTIKTQIELQNKAAKLSGGNVLDEVIVTAKKIVKDSKNLNGPGEADQVFDEKDLEKAGKMNWLQFIKQNVAGFDQIIIPGSSPSIILSRLNGTETRFIVDGVELVTRKIGVGEHYEQLNHALENSLAEEIKGIEVHTSFKSRLKYNKIFAQSYDWFDFRYIEITTHSGMGPSSKPTPGIYIHKPLAPAYPKQFYRPKYAVKDFTLPDLRSTLHWEPNIITNSEGKAFVSFYAADQLGTYTVIVEGSDMNGNLGRKVFKLRVADPK